MELKQTIHNIWMTNFNRQGINKQFKPVFERYIGTNQPNEFNDYLKFLNDKYKENKKLCIIFNKQIKLDGKISQTLSPQLNSINPYQLKSSDIVGLFDDDAILNRFVESLNYIIELANLKENFQNDNIRRNFIKKILVWTFSYIKLTDIHFSESICPKCIFYGDIDRHEIYFLILLHLMSFDVLYINPENDSRDFNDIDKDSLSTVINEKNRIDIIDFDYRVSKGKEMNQIVSTSLNIEQGINEEFYNNGIYKPWQYRDGITKSLFFRSTIYDLMTYWNEPAKVRDGFKVENELKRVTIPCFFQKIEGEHENLNEYKELIKKCISSKNTLLLNQINDDVIEQNFISNKAAHYTSKDALSITFALDENGDIDFDKISRQKYFEPLKKYKTEIQKFIIFKLNDFFNDTSLLNYKISKEDKCTLVLLAINMHEKFIRLIDSFDFTSYIPKIVVFLDKTTQLNEIGFSFLGLFSKMGFDILIFNPSGMFNHSAYINDERINVIRLEQMNYERTFSSLNINNFSHDSSSKTNNNGIKGLIKWLLDE